MKHVSLTGLLVVLVCFSHNLMAQQFNTDNYWAMPHGASSLTLTAGTEYIGFQPSFALANKWEFFVGAFLTYEKDNSTANYSTTIWGKRNLYENKQKNGGLAMAGGIGGNPGFYSNAGLTDSYRTWWLAPMISIPFFKGQVSLDLNPGVVFNTDYNNTGDSKWGFQHSGRLAVTVIPSLDVVGEVWGIEGGAKVNSNWRLGLRWSNLPYLAALAASYSKGFDGTDVAGFEIGITLYTDRIYCFRGCQN
jgi:hypothetical protein